jgi:hypothetical protein
VRRPAFRPALLLDRGWGRLEQSHVGLDRGDIKVTIRQIIESDDD